MQVKFIKILSKKEKVKTENIVVNAINLSDGEKQQLGEYRKKLSYSTKK